MLYVRTLPLAPPTENKEKYGSLARLHSTVPVRAKLATTNLLVRATIIRYKVSLIFEWSGLALLGPFLATPLGSGTLTSNDLPGPRPVWRV